jgi:hypothetical protein
MLNKHPKSVLCLFALIWLFKADLKAQDGLHSITMPVYVRSSFFYDFPQSFGVSAGVDFPIKSKVITTTRKIGKEVIKYRDLIIAGDIGFYRYPFNNSGLYFFQSIGKRYNKGKPYYFEWLVRVGVLRTFYDGQVYTVDDNGTVKELNNYGRYYAVTGFTTIFGHDFERTKKPGSFAIDLKPSLWVQYPYNSFFLLHLSAEISFKYHFNNLNMRIKQKQVVHLLSK